MLNWSNHVAAACVVEYDIHFHGNGYKNRNGLSRMECPVKGLILAAHVGGPTLEETTKASHVSDIWWPRNLVQYFDGP